MGGAVIIIGSDAAWQTKLAEAKAANKTVVVDFTATWCGPCRMIAPFFEALADKFPGLWFFKVDVDTCTGVAAECGIQAMPTFQVWQNGQKAEELVGASKENLEKMVAKFSASSVQARCSLPPAPQLVYTLAAAPRTPPAPPAPPFALAFVAVSLSGALAACLLAAIPTLLSLKRAADELAALAATIRAEVPDTAAAVRLSGLELSDAFEEVSGLTSDLSGGLRSSARALSAAEAGVRAVGAAVRTRALPAVVRRVVPVAREAVARSQDMLAERAGMDDYSGPALAAAAQGTSASVSKLRTALQAAGVAKRLGRAIAFVRATVRSDAPKQ